jgi:hypothetical protein
MNKANNKTNPHAGTCLNERYWEALLYKQTTMWNEAKTGIGVKYDICNEFLKLNLWI